MQVPFVKREEEEIWPAYPTKEVELVEENPWWDFDNNSKIQYLIDCLCN